MSKLTWNDEVTAALKAKADALGVAEISQEQVVSISVELATETGKEVSARSIGSKLRKEGYEVQKAADAVKSPWTPENEQELVDFLNAHPGAYTYAEVAAAVIGGAFTAKQVQGKVLSLELTSAVKPAEKVATVRSYSPEEETTFVNAVANGETLEEIVARFPDRNIKQIRGKALSLLREKRIEAMPVQSESTAKVKEDVLVDVDTTELTVAEIAEKTGKTERGVKSMLSRRGLVAKDYDGAAKRTKLDSKGAKAE
jgi:hypothetical protein